MKKLSKFLSMILIAALIMTGFTGFSGSKKVSAAEGVNVYVSISDRGDLVLKQKSVEVTDVDADGALTISDALYCAHEKYYKGGAEAGYECYYNEAYMSLSLSKLWGYDEGTSFDYYVNDQMSMGLSDPISEGDYLNAFVYVDQPGYSDKYSFFNAHKIGVKNGASKKIALYVYDGYDENWMPIKKAMKNAKIIINEKETDYVTGKKGKVTLNLEKSGSYFISAVSDDVTLVPPTCLVFVQPAKGEIIEVKDKKYTVTKLGKVSTGKKGKVTFSKSANGDKEAPKTIEYAGVTYKVKVVD